MPNSPNHLQHQEETKPRRTKAGRISARVLFEKMRVGPSIETLIDATQGPFIEVGAVPSSPRPRDSLLELGGINKRLLTSNHYQPETIRTAYKRRLTGERKFITHRDDTPSPRTWRPIGADFKTEPVPGSWDTTQVRDNVDFIGDATVLPIPDGSVGALYSIALHPDAESRFVSDEAPRTLEPGGVLVLDRAKPESIAADNLYLDTIRLDSYGEGDQAFINYAAVRNEVPYDPPQARTPV